MKTASKHLGSYFKMLFMSLLMLGIQSCDRCKDIECKNYGVCEKGVCECTEKYRGDLCSLQRQPRTITIKKVVIAGVESMVNAEWDPDGSLPDIFLGIQKGTDTHFAFTSEEVYTNSSADEFTFEEGLSMQIETQTEVFRFSLVDLDNGYGQEVFWCTAVLYHSKNGLPDVYEFEFQSGATIKVWLEYEF